MPWRHGAALKKDALESAHRDDQRIGPVVVCEEHAPSLAPQSANWLAECYRCTTDLTRFGNGAAGRLPVAPMRTMRNRRLHVGDSVSFTPKRPRRRSDALSDSVARIGWMLVMLLTHGVMDVAQCEDVFRRSRREVQRDLRQLRTFGKDFGFSITPVRGGRVFLHSKNGGIARLSRRSGNAAATLARIAAALGAPVEGELRDAIGQICAIGESDGFLHLREAAPRDAARVTETFALLKAAAAAHARVEFPYTTSQRNTAVRTVEPYHVIVRSGRSYLVGYDLGRRDWRKFALDAIGRPIRKVGTFTRRIVPPHLLADRAVGWFSGSVRIDVTVRFSALVAAAVTGQQWQREQRVTPLADGGAEIVLAFADLGEAVRWALRFGPEAAIVAPPEAVALARGIVERIARTYDAAARRERVLRTG